MTTKACPACRRGVDEIVDTCQCGHRFGIAIPEPPSRRSAAATAIIYAVPGAAAGYVLAEHYPLFSNILTQRLCQPYSPCRDAEVPTYVVAGILLGALVGLSAARGARHHPGHVVELVAAFCLALIGAIGWSADSLVRTNVIASASVEAGVLAEVNPVPLPAATDVSGSSPTVVFPSVCDVESEFEANEIAAIRHYPEGARVTVSFDVAAVNAGYSQPSIEPAGCRTVRLPFDDIERLAALRPGDRVVARCTFNFWYGGHTYWGACTFGGNEPAPLPWFCACVSERTAPETPPTPTSWGTAIEAARAEGLNGASRTNEDQAISIEPISVTVCRPTSSECDRLVARAERGSRTLVGVVAPCIGVDGRDRPTLNLQEGEILEPSSRAGGWQIRGRCAINPNGAQDEL